MSRPKLPLPLGELVDQRTPARAPQMWREIQARARAHRRPPRGPLVLLAATLASMFAVIAWLGGSHRWLPAAGSGLQLADGRALPGSIEPASAYAALDLSDGSRVTVAQRAHLDVLETSSRAVSLALRSGRARFDVRPRGPRTWRIECGPQAVEVVGTAFVLERTPTALQIEVLRGAVLVRGERVPDGVQRLNAGERLRVSNGGATPPTPLRSSTGVSEADSASVQPFVASAPAAQAPAREASEPDRAPEVGAAPSTASVAVRGARRPPTAAARARVSGPHQPTPHVAPSAARAGVAPEPGAPEPVPAARAERSAAPALDVDALLREADALRLAGRPAAAVVPLTRAVQARPVDARTALAAFALGRLRLNALDDPLQASRDLQHALAFGLPLALQEDAYAKLVEAHERAGDLRAACAALAQYVQRFPDGTRAEAERRRCRVERDR